jgi:hypothetical protein
VGTHPGVFAAVAAAVILLNVALPPVVLSLARKPVDYFTVNPWLKQLPAYVASGEVPLATKLEKLPALALFWFSADSPYGGVDWGFAVDVTDAIRLLVLGLLFGTYFALWTERRGRATGRPPPVAAGRGGVAGALVGVVGFSTGPCSVMGCGAPVIPVVGLAFAGLSSGTLALLAGLSRVATVAVLLMLAAGISYLAWHRDQSLSPDRPWGPGAGA